MMPFCAGRPGRLALHQPKHGRPMTARPFSVLNTNVNIRDGGDLRSLVSEDDPIVCWPSIQVTDSLCINGKYCEPMDVCPLSA